MSTKVSTVRRSVVLPASLVQDAMHLIKPKGRLSFNGVVKLALQEMIRMRKKQTLLRELNEMAADPQIQDEYRRIEDDFALWDMDGLNDSAG
jgi:hypothetical protein